MDSSFQKEDTGNLDKAMSKLPEEENEEFEYSESDNESQEIYCFNEFNDLDT